MDESFLSENPIFISENSSQASDAQALNLEDSTVLLVEDNDMHEPFLSKNPIFISENSFHASDAQALNLEDSTVLLVEETICTSLSFRKYGATYLNFYIT